MASFHSLCASYIGDLSRALAQLSLVALELERASYNPDQPRWPAGTPGAPKPGGRWSPGDQGSAGGSGDIWVRPKAKPNTSPNDVGRKAVASAAKAGVRWLARAALDAAGIAAPEIAAALEIGELLAEAALPYVLAYFDPPQSLANLNAAANDPQTGYDIHHIVEQATAAADGSEDDLMDSPDNLVRIPTLKHWELNAWYTRPNPDFGNQSPRQYLSGKSWDERRLVGLIGLQKIGVLHGN
jgi:hypothetical protein